MKTMTYQDHMARRRALGLGGGTVSSRRYLFGTALDSQHPRFWGGGPTIRLAGFLLGAFLAIIPIGTTACGADEPTIFSGPQPGEPLPPLRVERVYTEDQAKVVDLVTADDQEPKAVIFIHKVTRPSIGLVRLLTQYTMSRAEDGLQTAVVWLSDDRFEARQTLQRIRHAMTDTAPTGISLEGKEGPGTYGLNRNVTLTILVANEGKVTANFALVQPSIQADLPAILQAIVDQIGGKRPGLQQLVDNRMAGRRMNSQRRQTRVQNALRMLIDKSASDDEVDGIAQRISRRMEQDRSVRDSVSQIAQRIVRSGKLDDYGTPRARRYLRAWAAEAQAAAKADKRQATEDESTDDQSTNDTDEQSDQTDSTDDDNQPDGDSTSS